MEQCVPYPMLKVGGCKNCGPRLVSYQSFVNKAEFKWQITGRLGRCARINKANRRIGILAGRGE